MPITLPSTLPSLRLLLVWDNLQGHLTPSLVSWLFSHGVMPLYTPLSGSWLNMAESIQRIISRRALAGQYPQTPEQIISALEATVTGWNVPSLSVGSGAQVKQLCGYNRNLAARAQSTNLPVGRALSRWARAARSTSSVMATLRAARLIVNPKGARYAPCTQLLFSYLCATLGTGGTSIANYRPTHPERALLGFDGSLPSGAPHQL